MASVYSNLDYCNKVVSTRRCSKYNFLLYLLDYWGHCLHWDYYRRNQAQSANNGNLWKGTANTFRSEPFTSTYNATAGLYIIGFVWNASATTTAPSISAGRSLNNQNESSMDFTNSAALVARGTGNSMPSSIAYSSLAIDVTRPWVALY